jgi:His-Xaa-Ser system protein HxsD
MSIGVSGRPAPASDFVNHLIEVDTTLHPVSAVQRTCYALAGMAVFEMSREDNGVRLRVTPREGQRLDDVLDRFKTSLMDFTLREEIEARTQGLRELIWQTAFAEMRGRGL